MLHGTMTLPCQPNDRGFRSGRGRAGAVV